MAESAVFSLASKILLTIATPAFNKAYERGLSIWEARDELAKLRVTIETIHAVLLDAERKQESSVAVKNWIKRLKGVLYDADDLFDDVATDDLLKQQMMEGNNKLSLKKKVRVSCSRFVSRNSIAKQVKAIRQILVEISDDMAQFEFLRCLREEPMFGVRGRQDPGCFVDAKNVVGRKQDKKAILDMLFNESSDAKSDVPVVIAVVGIGGMGKTTLAQLIYNDDAVKKDFEKRWFACISDTLDEKEVLGKIFQSICEGSYKDFTVGQLQTKIRDSVGRHKFLLVLDDVWDDHRGRWQDRMSLLGSVKKGSKIIVTTRSSTVAKATDALSHTLNGLSEDESWSLFKRVAFIPEQENDPRWTNIGREIVKKCRNVPLAIKSVGSLLFEKHTLQEWESFKDEQLSMLREQGGDYTMNTLKLSYEHLSSSLKHCFAYCALFPKDTRLEVKMLVYLWIAQGYIKPDNDLQRIEKEGKSCFMYLLRRGFFQEVEKDEYGEIMSCKMHDLIHDLAQHVAGEESIILTESSNTSNCARHVSTGNSKVDDSWVIPPSLLNANQLRSCFLLNGRASCNPTLLDQLFVNFKRLRALTLSRLEIKNVPNSIGELKHLRYLDLSWNNFKSLPDSVTNLLNLIKLDISWCSLLKALPDDWCKLINLRYLSIACCWGLKHMPPGMGKMTCLQHLSDFKVGKATSKGSGFDALVGLVEQLRGELSIQFEVGIEDWDGDEGWKLPICLQRLNIHKYPGMRMPDWGSNGGINNLACLKLSDCKKVTNLPPLRCLPYLKRLDLWDFPELEFIEDGDSCTTVAGSLFFPRLESLELAMLPKLKGWSRKVAAAPSSTSSALLSFPLLSRLEIESCPELKSFPLCPRLQKLDLYGINEEIEKLLSNNPNSSPASTTPSPSSSFFQEILISPHLQCVHILECQTLEIMHLAPPKLQQLSIRNCGGLKKLHIAHPNGIEKLEISECPELELWDSQDKRSCHLDWDSFTNLRVLWLDPLPRPEKLPQCLRHRQTLGQLQITKPTMVLKFDLHDGDHKKALKTLSALSGIDSIAMDMKEKKLTVIGVMDPITTVIKLRKYGLKTNIIYVGAAKEPEKPAES